MGLDGAASALRGDRSDVGSIAMKRMVLVSMIGSLLAAGSGPAIADDLRGALQVMGPKGTVLRISSPSADTWWEDYYRARCVSGKGPQQAAQLLDEVERALGTRFSAGPRYLILPESLELGWPYAWFFYPSTDRTPAYVVRHGGVRAGGGGLQWDAWMPATERMEALILEGAGEPSQRSEGAASDAAGARFLPWALVGALVGATLSAAFSWWLFGFVRRRGTPPKRSA